MTTKRETAEVAARLGRLGFGPYDALRLMSLSRSLSRIGERQCNEDTACPACRGEGFKSDAASLELANHPAVTREPCKACGGTGDTLGRREARLVAEARSIAKHFGLLVYYQGDPRGAALHLYRPEDAKGDISCRYSSVGTAIY